MTCSTCAKDEGQINPIAGVLLPCPECRAADFDIAIAAIGVISPLHRAMLKIQYRGG